MSFLLQLDTVCAIFRSLPVAAARAGQNQGQLFLAAPTVTPLEIWLTHPKTPGRYLLAYQSVLAQLQVLDLTEEIAHRAAQISGRLAAQNKKLNAIDLFVAATAVERGLTLVTHASSMFAFIPSIAIVDWMVP